MPLTLMHSPSSPTPEEIETYLSGGCGSFAIALWLAHGKPTSGTIGVMAAADGEPWSDSFPFDFTHVFYERGDQTIDVGGIRTLSAMEEDLHLGAGYDYHGPLKPTFVRRYFMGNTCRPLLGSQREITRALALILQHKNRYGLGLGMI